MKWKVVVESTGVPLVYNTNPPGAEFDTQSPVPSGVFARRSPSMAKPPAGGLTGASPGSGTESVNVVVAVRPDGSPMAVTRRVAPPSSSFRGTIHVVTKLPSLSAETFHGAWARLVSLS